MYSLQLASGLTCLVDSIDGLRTPKACDGLRLPMKGMSDKAEDLLLLSGMLLIRDSMVVGDTTLQALMPRLPVEQQCYRLQTMRGMAAFTNGTRQADSSCQILNKDAL